ncbi:MAG: Xaa-Pro peptidase family protein [Chloroflexi bacterium]|nr:Xaa-Pro peptidase family protein [Chloroflexota bacterium]MCL5273648.1 Xaa-Pro peptidase family protein [Chloroflexota bacterium]
MKSDLPRLMQERGLDALAVIGPDGLGAANTAFTYFTGATHVTNGTIIVKRAGDNGSQSYLVHSPMERDEAAMTGLQLVSASDYKMPQIIQQCNGDRLAARVEFMRRLFGDLGVGGRVGFYGADSVGATFSFLSALSRAEFVDVATEYENDVISQARKTKDGDEVAQIRQACRLTESVIGETRDFLRRQRVSGDVLIKQDGAPLTIGDVKAFIRREEAAAGLDDPGCIFAIGRDAGVPHSSGTPSDTIRLGQTIVFDIFPRIPGGYYADITRTWCLGYASDEVQRAYALVMKVHDDIAAAFNTQRNTYEFQDMACDIFESHGHATIRQDLSVTSGFVHSLGHGFGLDIHEPPGMGLRGVRADEQMQRGSIITNEPGLYYPDKGYGIRVEDDYWCNPQGEFECLTSFDRSLVVPM